MKYFLASLQWMMFILMGSIIIPIAITTSYGLQAHEAVGFVSRTLFVLGAAGILQVLFGHKLPVAEGPAGIWWGVFVLFASVGASMFGSTSETLRVLEFCFIASGLLFIVLALLGVVPRIAKLFTPTVMATFLILLVVQLAPSFLLGMLGVRGQGGIDYVVFALSIGVVLISFVIQNIRPLAAYATLFAIGIGWVLFIIFGRAKGVFQTDQWFQLPELFAFGWPKLEASMLPNVFFLTMLLLTNMLASIKAMQIIYKEFGIQTQDRLKQATFTAGIIHMLSGVFSAIGPVPLSGSAAFVYQTRVPGKIPFIVANALIILVSLSPAIMVYFAALPTAVGYAALLPTFGFGIMLIAMRQLTASKQAQVRNQTVAISWFFGMGVMFLPQSVYEGMPLMVSSIASNGVIIGTVLAIIVERTLLSKKMRMLTAKRMNRKVENVCVKVEKVETQA